MANRITKGQTLEPRSGNPEANLNEAVLDSESQRPGKGPVEQGLEITAAPLGGSALSRAYLAGDTSAAPFYGHSEANPTSVEPLVRQLDAQWTSERRQALVPLLRGTAAGDTGRLSRFVEEGGFVVTTGQQAGFLTGPLYTLSKALGAVAHARRLERWVGRPVLPVFWIASEDHDWDEAESARVLGTDGAPVNLRAEPAEPPAGRSVFAVPLAPPTDTLGTLEALWPPGGVAAEALELITAAYPPAATLASGCEYLLDALLGEEGLFLVQSHDPLLKEQTAHVIRAAVEGAEPRLRAMRDRADELEAAGFHQQVTGAPGATHVLVTSAQGRRRLFVHGGGFRIGTDGPSLPASEVLSAIDSDPSFGTPDALLRPVVEAAAFPVLAYVAGPGELAYYAQNGPLYDAADVIRPHLFGRPAVSVVEPKVRRALDRIGLDPTEVLGTLDAIQTRLARERIPQDVYTILERGRETYTAAMDALGDQVETIDPTMRGPVLQAGRRGSQSLDRAEKKIMQAVKRRSVEALRHLDRARAHLLPEGTPQERALNVFHFLGRYGLGFVSQMADAITGQVGE